MYFVWNNYHPFILKLVLTNKNLNYFATNYNTLYDIVINYIKLVKYQSLKMSKINCLSKP